MRSVALLAAGLSLALAGPCLAQTTQSSPASPQPGQSPIQVPSKSGGQAANQPQSQATGQSGSQAANQSGSQSSHQTIQAQAVAQRMKQELEQAGFTDVRIIPESFLVRAHDKEGRPVVMMVNPHSVLAVTKLGGQGKMANSGNSGGSGSGSTTYQ